MAAPDKAREVLSELLANGLRRVHAVHPRSHLAPFFQCVVVLVPSSAIWCRRLARSLASTVLGGLAGCALALALGLTLFRGSYGHESLSGLRRCAMTDPWAVSPEGLANVALFAPAAFLAVLAVGRPWLVAAGIAVVSLSVEAVQALEWIGVCDSSDVIHNTTGGLVAALVAAVVRAKWVVPRAAVSGSGACRRSC